MDLVLAKNFLKPVSTTPISYYGLTAGFRPSSRWYI